MTTLLLIENQTQYGFLNQEMATLFLDLVLTVAWAIESIAFLGSYLEHRRKSPIGIQVLWRGWSNLHDLCQGWLLAQIHT